MPRKQALTCSDCEKPMQWGKSSLPQGRARCMPCRRASRVYISHGYVSYTKGCRCGVCRDGQRIRMRDYVARVKARDGLTPTQKIRGVIEPKRCVTCGGDIMRTSLETPMCNPCRARTRRGIHISKTDRLSVYERDSWVCGFCSEGVLPDAPRNGPWSATLDHIIPRSLGGSDDPTNLRIAHRYCNSVRSNRLGLTLEDLAA